MIINIDIIIRGCLGVVWGLFKCIEAYGEEFGKIYDNLCMGIPVGGFKETAIILLMIEDVRNKKRTENKGEIDNETENH